MDLAKVVSRTSRKCGIEGEWQLEGGFQSQDNPRFHVVAYDYGVKRNILRMLAQRGCKVTVLPAQTPVEEVFALKPDGVFLSNGPGDPEPCDYAIDAIRKVLDKKIPLFGICLGHQLLALASGAKTMKMKFGHHGANHPVQDLDSGRVMITSQNHGFAVDPATLPANLRVTHKSLFDGSNQGIEPHRRAGVQLPGAPRSQPRSARRGLFVRPLHFHDATEKVRSERREELRSRARLSPHVLTPHPSPKNMPKRTDIHSILIIGAGPIVIGQACEFDYSGAQACKALREEGYRVILVNSNPATIMTDPEMADATYIEPITWQVVEKIIEKERPDALLPTMGGQTALNCALDLAKHGVLEKFGVEMIGATKEAIDKAEDREKFKKAMEKIGLACPRAAIAHSLEEAFQVQAMVGYPTIIRPSFTMGGSGGGIAYNKEEFVAICERGLEASPTANC